MGLSAPRLASETRLLSVAKARGDDITLLCQAQASPLPVVRWAHYRTLILLDLVVRMVVNLFYRSFVLLLDGMFCEKELVPKSMRCCCLHSVFILLASIHEKLNCLHSNDSKNLSISMGTSN